MGSNSSRGQGFASLGLGVKVVGMFAKRLKIQLGMRNKFQRYTAVPRVNTVFLCLKWRFSIEKFSIDSV